MNEVGLSIDYDFFLTDRLLEKEFWNQLQKRRLTPSRIVYGDDHKSAYRFFEPFQLDTLIHFDEHSDCYDKNLSSVTTENWLLKLMRRKPQLKVIWIQNKLLSQLGTEERSVIYAGNWIEPPWCFKELKWEYDTETKEHFLSRDDPQLLSLLNVWTQLDKATKIAQVKNPDVIGCYVSRSPEWTKDRSTQNFKLFLKRSRSTFSPYLEGTRP